MEPSAHLGKIDTNGLQALIASKVTMTLIDSRGTKFDDGKRIGPAIHLNSEASHEEIQKRLPSKESLVVIYCKNPSCPASQRLSQVLTELGYKNILKYEEGIEGWINAGLSVRTS